MSYSLACQATLLSEAYAAIEVSDYIIGSGSCGVSQFLALNLGAKRRIGNVALFSTRTRIYLCVCGGSFF